MQNLQICITARPVIYPILRARNSLLIFKNLMNDVDWWEVLWIYGNRKQLNVRNRGSSYGSTRSNGCVSSPVNIQGKQRLLILQENKPQWIAHINGYWNKHIQIKCRRSYCRTSIILTTNIYILRFNYLSK